MNRLLEEHLIDGQGDDIGFAVSGRAHVSDLIEEMQEFSAVYIASEVRFVRRLRTVMDAVFSCTISSPSNWVRRLRGNPIASPVFASGSDLPGRDPVFEIVRIEAVEPALRGLGLRIHEETNLPAL